MQSVSQVGVERNILHKTVPQRIEQTSDQLSLPQKDHLKKDQVKSGLSNVTEVD